MSLIERWSEVAGNSRAAQAVGAELVARWAEAHRRYHTTDHLRAVLDAITPLAELAADPTAVRLAAWFHDAVYDGHPGRDEERSAQLAQATLRRCGLGRALTAETARLVRLTATHDPAPGDANGAVLCDADLAILAAPEPGYLAYVRAVRAEYAHLPDQVFSSGRAMVLRGLLALPSLYRTRPAHDLWESAARANMSAELTRLDR